MMTDLTATGIAASLVFFVIPSSFLAWSKLSERDLLVNMFTQGGCIVSSICYGSQRELGEVWICCMIEVKAKLRVERKNTDYLLPGLSVCFALRRNTEAWLGNRDTWGVWSLWVPIETALYRLMSPLECRFLSESAFLTAAQCLAQKSISIYFQKKLLAVEFGNGIDLCPLESSGVNSF